MASKPIMGHEHPAILRYDHTGYTFGNNRINRPMMATYPCPFSQWDDELGNVPEADCVVTKQVTGPREYWMKAESSLGMAPCYMLGHRRISLCSVGKNTALTINATYDGFRTLDLTGEAALVILDTWPPHWYNEGGKWYWGSPTTGLDILAGQTQVVIPDYFYRYQVDILMLRILLPGGGDPQPDRVPWIKLDMTIA